MNERIKISDLTSMTVPNSGVYLFLEGPEYSEWKCHLFGGIDGDGLSWTPLKGCEPNWFWRKMQFVCFGNRWVKAGK